MTLRLRLLQFGQITQYAFDREHITLGRAPSNDIVLGPGTALHHGVIHVASHEVLFEDTAGLSDALVVRDGDFVSDDLYEPSRENTSKIALFAGDLIVFGSAEVRVEILSVEQPTTETIGVDDLSVFTMEPCTGLAATLTMFEDGEPLFVLTSQFAEVASRHLTGRLARSIVAIFHNEDEFIDEAYAYLIPEQEGLSSDSDIFDVTHNPLMLLPPEQRQMVEDALAVSSACVQCTLSSGRQLLCLGLYKAGALHGVLALEWEGDRSLIGEAFGEVLGSMQTLGHVALRLHGYEKRIKSVAEENRYFLERERRHYLYKELICESDAMRRVYDRLNKLVTFDEPVLILGEAGSGKELLARALHHLGTRQEGMFISVHCGHLTGETLGLELFGCVASVLVGAVAARKGVFELAHLGTVYLEEVHLMPLAMQAKLVRMIKEGEVRRIGDAVGRKVDARVLVSTHHDIQSLVRQGVLRHDLFLLIKEHTLEVPPLRARRADLLSLARTFLKKFARRYDRQVSSFDQDVEDVLMEHDWPGNIRELQTLIEAAVLHTPPEATSVSMNALTIHTVQD